MEPTPQVRTDESETRVEHRHDSAIALLEARVDEATGFLHVEGIAAVPGVLRYPHGRELVDEQTIANSGSIVGVPTTVRHPRGGRVNSRNAKRVSVGSVNEQRIDEASGALIVSTTTVDADAIRRVKSDLNGLSPGYTVVLDHTPGVHPVFGPYDARQVRRQYNHLAYCSTATARGGSGCRVRIDEDQHMIKHLIALLAVAGVRIDSNATDEEIEKATEDGIAAIKATNKERAQLKVRIDSMPTEDELRVRFDEQRKERDGLVETAGKMGITADLSEKSTQDIARTIAKHYLGDRFDESETSADYIRFAVDGARAALSRKPKGFAGFSESFAPPKNERADEDTGRKPIPSFSAAVRGSYTNNAEV